MIPRSFHAQAAASCGTGGNAFNVAACPTAHPIHLGSGEPVLLLHPFLISQLVWETVAQQLADTGRYEVFAPTMAGHNGGPKSGTWFLSSTVLADHVERQLDELGWETAHIVGNSLGGWVAFELERRGRARTVTGIAPAGGWTRWTPAKFEVVAKFVSGMPFWVFARLLGPRALRLPYTRQTVHAADQRDARRGQRRTVGRHRRRCRALPRLLPAAGQIADAAGAAGVGADRGSRPSGALRKGPGVPRAPVPPLLPGPASGRHSDHRARGRRTHPDVRGAGPGDRSHRLLPGRAQFPAGRRPSGQLTRAAGQAGAT